MRPLDVVSLVREVELAVAASVEARRWENSIQLLSENPAWRLVYARSERAFVR
jgi:hypothetical protein